MSSTHPALSQDVVHRLLRQHPKVHPESEAAEEFRALGLGHLPFLEFDLEQPWGRFLEEASPSAAAFSAGDIGPSPRDAGDAGGPKTASGGAGRREGPTKAP